MARIFITWPSWIHQNSITNRMPHLRKMRSRIPIRRPLNCMEFWTFTESSYATAVHNLKKVQSPEFPRNSRNQLEKTKLKQTYPTTSLLLGILDIRLDSPNIPRTPQDSSRVIPTWPLNPPKTLSGPNPFQYPSNVICSNWNEKWRGFFPPGYLFFVWNRTTNMNAAPE